MTIRCPKCNSINMEIEYFHAMDELPDGACISCHECGHHSSVINIAGSINKLLLNFNKDYKEESVI